MVTLSSPNKDNPPIASNSNHCENMSWLWMMVLYVFLQKISLRSNSSILNLSWPCHYRVYTHTLSCYESLSLQGEQFMKQCNRFSIAIKEDSRRKSMSSKGKHRYIRQKEKYARRIQNPQVI
jgi:hypothetical protein